MNYFVGPNGTYVMVPRDLCERLCAALPPGTLREELHSYWKGSDLSRPRSAAPAAVVLEPDSSTIHHHEN